MVVVDLPLRAWFDDSDADEVAVESRLLFPSADPTDRGWSWLTDSEVHFRPSAYGRRTPR